MSWVSRVPKQPRREPTLCCSGGRGRGPGGVVMLWAVCLWFLPQGLAGQGLLAALLFACRRLSPPHFRHNGTFSDLVSAQPQEGSSCSRGARSPG